MPWNVNQPQVCPLVTIPLNVAASKNWSNKFSRSFAFILRLTVGKNFFSFLSRDYESVVETSFNPIIDLNVPIFQGSSDGFNLRLDRELYIGKNGPGF